MNYHLLYALVFLGAVSSFLPPLKKYRSNVSMYLVAILALFAGLRYWIGFDFDNYFNMFRDTPTIRGLFTYWHVLGVERGYFILNSVIKTMGMQVNGVLVVMAVATLIILMKSFQKYTPYPLMALLLYVSRFFFVRDMGQIRASLAAAIVLFSLRYLQKRETWKFFLTIFIAFLFHRIALVGILLYIFQLIFRKGIATKWVVGLLALSFLVGSIDLNPIILSMEGIIPEHYWQYLTHPYYVFPLGLTNPVLLMQLMILIAMLLFRKQIKNDYFNLLLGGYLMSTLILSGLQYFGTVAGRLSTYFATFEIVIIPLFIDVFQEHDIRGLLPEKWKMSEKNFIGRLKPKNFIIVFMFLYATFIYYIIFVNDVMPYFMPYRSVLNP
ncbi:MAG: EpsG family protein [Turicibacter sp.]|nr:EpsG family protein [Turicibacter sp.]